MGGVKVIKVPITIAGGVVAGIIGHQFREPIIRPFDTPTARIACYTAGHLICSIVGAFIFLAMGNTREDAASFFVASLLAGGGVGAGVALGTYLEAGKK